jgi:hypothetical protein
MMYLNTEHYYDADVAERFSIFFVLGSQKKQGKFTHFGAADGGGAGDEGRSPSTSTRGGSGQMSAVAVATNGMGAGMYRLNHFFLVSTMSYNSMLVSDIRHTGIPLFFSKYPYGSLVVSIIYHLDTNQSSGKHVE